MIYMFVYADLEGDGVFGVDLVDRRWIGLDYISKHPEAIYFYADILTI